jgi:hypothetical protein
MSTNLDNQPVPDLFELLYERYMEDHIGTAGEPKIAAPVKKLTEGRSMEAVSYMREAVEGFKNFCQQFMRDNRPEGVSSLSSGFGIRLAGGYEVTIVDLQDSDEHGMEAAGDVPVTSPRSLRGQRGVQHEPGVDITPGK